MKIEFTKKIKSNNWNDIRIAVNERRDNLLLESLTPNQNMLLERLKTDPDPFWGLQEYTLLTEMAVQTRKLWNKDLLNVYFFGGLDSRTRKVISIASEWSNYCNISFNQVDNIESSDIRISFNEPGSWSYIGTDAKGVNKNEPTVNFGWLNSGLDEKEYRRVVLHEFGHVLGLLHEHQNPSVQVNWDKPKVYWYCNLYFGWSQQTTDINIIQEFEKKESKFSRVDKESIMGYWIPPEFTKDGTAFPLNFELSKMDKDLIGQIYK